MIGSLLPDNVNKVIYMDCDVLVLKSLRSLYEYPLNNNIMAAVHCFLTELEIACKKLYGHLKKIYRVGRFID